MDNHWFEALKEDRKENAKILAKASMGGVKDSVVEKYTEQAHFIYELLQNADDVNATKVSFRLENDGLIFIHNGNKRFSVTNPKTEEADKKNGNLGHINAITSIGQSSKIEQQIGKFGVGFKAVFQYTENPKIYDDNYKFEIKEFIVPYELKDDYEGRRKHHTLFYFPFNHKKNGKKQAYKEISDRLENLNNPLLFINNLQKIEWSNNEIKGVYSKEIINKSNRNNIQVDEVIVSIQLQNQTTKQSFLTFTQKIEGSNFDCSIAYPLQNGKIESTKDYPAFCFFPTRERTNLKFLIQAPFLLIDNRQGIKRGNTWNEKIITQLANITAESIAIVKDLNLLNNSFFNVLPLEKAVFEDNEYRFYLPFFDKVLEKLSSDEPLLLTKEGGYTTKNNAYLAESTVLLELFSSKQLSTLFQNDNAHWIFPQLTGNLRRRSHLGDYLFDYLGIKELNITAIITQLHSVFLKEQPDEWLLSFYSYLSNTSFVWKALMTKPILRTSDNQQLSPLNNANELQVFLPSDLQSEFPTVKSFFLENEKSKQFLHGLKIRKPDLKAEIEISILPQYRERKYPNAEKLLQHFEVFYEYYTKCPQREMFEYLEKLRQILFIACVKDDVNRIAIPKVIYFKTSELSIYFENKKDVIWLNEGFYEKTFLKYGKEKILDFFKDLGVNETPRQEIINLNTTGDIFKYLQNQNISFSMYWKATYLNDYKIKNLEANFNNYITNEKSKIIWNLLAKKSITNDFEQLAEYSYFYYTNKYEYKDAHFLRLLKSEKWLFINNEAFKPSEVTVEQLAENNYPIEGAAYQKLIKILGIKQKEKEWQREFSEEEIKKMYELAQKAKDFSDEDFEELKKIKRQRAIIEKQKEKPTNTKTPDLVANSDFEKVLEKINSIERVVKSIEGESTAKQQAETFLSEVKKDVKNVQENSIKQRLLFFNLMSIKDFASELAHVIKTSLYNVMNRAKFIKKEFPNSDFDDLFKIYANDIHHEMFNLEKAVDFILGYATIDDNLEKFDIKQVIEDLFNYSIRDVLDEERINYEVSISETVFITYNKKAFEDIIENLITNSIKALKNTENKKITCKGIIEQNELILFISDNGEGIADDRKEKIFDIYETSTKEQGGSGIGLFSVKTRLKSLNGNIEVIENEFKPTGATFKITLPFKN